MIFYVKKDQISGTSRFKMIMVVDIKMLYFLFYNFSQLFLGVFGQEMPDISAGIVMIFSNC